MKRCISDEIADALRGELEGGRYLAGECLPLVDKLRRRFGAGEFAALVEMRKIAAKKPLPDLFLFTDDCVAQGALTALAVDGVCIPEDVKVVTHANKGLGPVWEKPLSRLEMDAASHANAVSSAVIDYLKTGVYPPSLDLGSVYRPGATF